MSFTVALVGPDGAGKTTVARRLAASASPYRFRYLYMGQSVRSSNAALPTTRVARRLKEREERTAPAATGRSRRRPGTIRRVAGLANRVVEAWWRQLLAASYRLRGYSVVCDRHYLFEAATYRRASEQGGSAALGRFEHFVVRHLYPRPDLVICLDASPEVLYARKGESSPSRLGKRRAAILEQGAALANFAVVDADRPLEQVVADVRAEIARFASSGRRGVLVGGRP